MDCIRARKRPLTSLSRRILKLGTVILYRSRIFFVHKLSWLFAYFLLICIIMQIRYGNHMRCFFPSKCMPISIDMWDFWFKISIHDNYKVNEEYRIHIDHKCIHSKILNRIIWVFKVNIMLISIIMQNRGTMQIIKIIYGQFFFLYH